MAIKAPFVWALGFSSEFNPFSQFLATRGQYFKKTTGGVSANYTFWRVLTYVLWCSPGSFKQLCSVFFPAPTILLEIKSDNGMNARGYRGFHNQTLLHCMTCILVWPQSSQTQSCTKLHVSKMFVILKVDKIPLKFSNKQIQVCGTCISNFLHPTKQNKGLRLIIVLNLVYHFNSCSPWIVVTVRK